jgi:hypothetical protein
LLGSASLQNEKNHTICLTIFSPYFCMYKQH